MTVHCLDLLTNGLLLLSRSPATRARYQQLFQDQEITKEYECLIVMPDNWHTGETRDITLLLDPNPAGRGVEVAETDVSARAVAKNPKFKFARTTVTFLDPVAMDIDNVLTSSRNGGNGSGVTSVNIPLHAVDCDHERCGGSMQVDYWRLQPHTNRTHRLWMTTDWLGYPTLDEDTYDWEAGAQGPSANVSNTPTYMPQLRLTATALAFVDPVTGRRRTYRNARNITAPADMPTTP